MKNDNKFKGKLIFKGKLEIISPMLIGNGEDEVTDNDIVKDHEGIPYIPATSFIGVLRSEFNERKIEVDTLFGYSKGEGSNQSPFYCKDLFTTNQTRINSRDGVKIDNKTGIAVKGAKYDYEILEPGSEFDFEIGFDIDENKKSSKLSYDDAIKFISNIYTILKNHGISLGAKSQNGLGKAKLEESELLKYDFSVKNDVVNWLRDNPGNKIEDNITENKELLSKFNFTLIANFAIKNSLIVRSYRTNSKVTDAEHIKSNGKPVLPGTSIKGAIRARAEKILNTIKPGITQQVIDKLFGNAGEGDNKSKSRLMIEESEIRNTDSAVQARVKIDRFTGGAIDGALFDSMPEFPKDGNYNIVLTFKIKDCDEAEAGLMLLVLKDLMTADLPIGGEKNVGRGVFNGKSAELVFEGEEYKFNTSGPVKDCDKLQKLVDALWDIKPLPKKEELKNGK